MKPFNLEEAKAGKPVCARDGRPVRIICFDVINEDYPLLGLVRSSDGGEFCISYTSQGKQYINMEDTLCDLFMKSVKRECWRNFYMSEHKGVYVGPSHKTKEDALTEINSASEYLYTAKVEWEE